MAIVVVEDRGLELAAEHGEIALEVAEVGDGGPALVAHDPLGFPRKVPGRLSSQGIEKIAQDTEGLVVGGLGEQGESGLPESFVMIEVFGVEARRDGGATDDGNGVRCRVRITPRSSSRGIGIRGGTIV
jgi:hypothetical protein